MFYYPIHPDKYKRDNYKSETAEPFSQLVTVCRNKEGSFQTEGRWKNLYNQPDTHSDYAYQDIDTR